MGGITVPGVWDGLKGQLVAARGPADVTFSRAEIDSRDVRAGDLFFATKGERTDGHDFVGQAIEAGASGAVIERPVEAARGCAVFHVRDSLEALQQLAGWWRRRHGVKVIAVTGSVGKTTCKEMIASVIGRRFRTLKSAANLNTEIGIPLTLLQLTDEHERAVLEFGMYSRGDVALLSSISEPAAGVVTNIGPVHLERLGSMGGIVAAKAELVEALPNDGSALLNGDDPRTAALAMRTSARVTYFGLSQQCAVRATGVESRGLEGTRFQLITEAGAADVNLPLPGKQHVYAALASAAVALDEGMSLNEVADALAAAEPELLGRVLHGQNGSIILDESYNASPASVLAALDLLAELPGRRVALLGDMLELGSAEDEGHRRAGRRAATACHVLLTVGQRARLLAEAAVAAGGAEVRQLSSTAEAIDALRKEVRSGDYVLVKASRAMAFEEVVAALVAK